MPVKYQLITELYQRTGKIVTKSPLMWQDFLSSACRNYKCRFDEQLLIYAQRPDAVAVARMETWNRRFGRWVKKNSRGIAVFDPKGRNILKYYFDVSDTQEGRYGGRAVPIWQMEGRYEQAITERLSSRFGKAKNKDFASFLMETVKNAIEDHLPDYTEQLKNCTQGSFLEELDSFHVEVTYQKLATASVSFMLMSRLGLDTKNYFECEDFTDIANFNTPATLNAIGIATSDISEMVLREISQAIRTVQIAGKAGIHTFAEKEKSGYDKSKNRNERSRENERTHLQQARKVSYTRPHIPEEARTSHWQIRPFAPELSGAAQESRISQPVDQRQTEPASARDRTDSTYKAGAVDSPISKGTGHNGRTEGESAHAVGRPDEQHPQPSRRDDPARTDLQLRLQESEPKAKDESHSQNEEAEEEHPPASFHFQQASPNPIQHDYHEGDVVYIGTEEYEIVTIRKDSISLRNARLPLFEEVYSRTAFEEKLLANPANDSFKSSGAESREAAAPQTNDSPDKPKTILPEKKNQQSLAPLKDTRRNFRIADDTNTARGPKEKFRNNMTAIYLLHRLEQKKRLATTEEQEVLSRYVGWGGLSMAFDKHNAAWAKEYKELSEALSSEEYRAAMESTLTAFYTPPIVIRTMYKALERLGFSEGRILEPSCGIGAFFGLLPKSMEHSALYGIEIDPLSGRIARQLYQKADIAIQGFENTELPDKHFDVVIGNVPFGDFKVNDHHYNKQNFLIHDYFFAKALDKVRPGGIVMFLTSKGTMDKKSPEMRKYIARRAELLGAIRLPDDTFLKNAGTQVTSDILILQKRDQEINVEPDWISLDTDQAGIMQNRYFVRHPEMVLGRMTLESTHFGMDTACKAYEDRPLSELLSEAVQHINGEIPDYEIDEISDKPEDVIPADERVRKFSYALMDGKIYFRENEHMTRVAVSVTAESRIRGLLAIRDCVRKLINEQINNCDEGLIHARQKTLNRLYDAFTKKYGRINDRGNYLAFAADESYFLLCSLEVLDDEGHFKRKADMFTKRTIRPRRTVTSVETASEALALSIGEKARVDLAYMEQLTGKKAADMIQELKGVIFKVPGSSPPEYVMADEYLSGDVRGKLIAARAAAKSEPELQSNVEALQQAIPKDLSATEIAVRLGTTWIPQEDIQQFVIELLSPGQDAAGKLKVRYIPFSDAWFIENKKSDVENIKAITTYGTKRASAYRLIEDSLNLKDTRIFDYVYDEYDNKKAVFNVKETMAAQAKQQTIKQEFQNWIWKDPERRNRLVRYYNDTFNNRKPRSYDGKHITFGGINPEITLRPHQVNAIAHILYGGNTLLAHKVGAGKTFNMIAAAQESKRLGLCHKSLFVVPNHLIGQWASEYLRLYPSANILVATKRDFETANRKKFCGRIAIGDYDAIIIGHSQFEKIPISEERQREQLQKQLDDIERGMEELKDSQGGRYTIKQMARSRKAITAKLDKLNDTKRKDKVIYFEELGVDRLFIDESHYYKNLYFYTKMRNVGGISQAEAQKSSDLFMKCRYLDEITGGRGIVFATGTPVSNSMVELYSLQRYLQYDTLEKNGLQHFDAWASTFGETVTALELAPEGYTFSRR
jgi:N12 class adenine-specific DNA methylase/adenine-specific DNA methylase